VRKLEVEKHLKIHRPWGPLWGIMQAVRCGRVVSTEAITEYETEVTCRECLAIIFRARKRDDKRAVAISSNIRRDALKAGS